MRAVLQRVGRASVEVDGDLCWPDRRAGWSARCRPGDTEEDAAWMADKVLNLRGFEDDRAR